MIKLRVGISVELEGKTDRTTPMALWRKIVISYRPQKTKWWRIRCVSGVCLSSPFPPQRKMFKNVYNELFLLFDDFILMCFILLLLCMWWEKSDSITCGIRRRSLSLCPFLVGRVTSITYGCCCCTPDGRHIHFPRLALTEIELLALWNEMSLLLLFSLVKTFVARESKRKRVEGRAHPVMCMFNVYVVRMNVGLKFDSRSLLKL